MSKLATFFLIFKNVDNALPAGQKNRHQKSDIKKEPMMAKGRMYHWIPIPSKENIIAKGSNAPAAGRRSEKINIKANHNRKFAMTRAFLIITGDGFKRFPLILFTTYWTP